VTDPHPSRPRYAVIFQAELAEVDDEYATTAKQLRDLALRQYGCRKFTAVTEDKQEIAISYWDSLEQIQAWKQDPLHQAAQQIGREQWYKSYKVQCVEIVREQQGP